MVPDRAESARRIVLPREDDFDPAETRSWLQARADAIRATGGVPVLSNERFSGNPHSGWFDADRTFDRLRLVLPEAKVLLVVREQRDLVRSLWLQYVRIGGPASLRNYLREPDPGDHRAPVFDLEFLRFDRVVEGLDRRFGRERVLVLPFERLVRDAKDFLARIAGFLGREMVPPPDPSRRIYAAPSLVSASLQRRINLCFVRSSLHRAAPWPSPTIARLAGSAARMFGHVAAPLVEPSMRRAAAARIESRLAAVTNLRTSNERLAARIGEDLGSLGWLMP